MNPKLVRCAVYTRKSTEHNLDLEFNSLEAQRESCEAYVKSQQHEGWSLIPDRYDDGGISGASLDRPDLKRLLRDIEAGKVDTVVVYKVDRLTRSLMDFAKLVELFDKCGVSFVSITQAFNTTTSMGRLTLNVLLSFAQFEREVIGERVRDKIAASKRKGLWMGGPVPLGYASQEKKLIIVPDEAESVRMIFLRYVELGAIGSLLQELDRVGIKTKARRYASGRLVGGGRFGKGGLNHLLKNRCYIGEIVHHDKIHPASHEPILDRALFDAVQAKLESNNVAKKLKSRSSHFLLQGLIFDSAGNRMSPTHSIKKGVRYRYYYSQALAQRRNGEAGVIARVPAPDLEALIWKTVAVRAKMSADTIPDPGIIEAHVQKVVPLEDVVELTLRPLQGAQELMFDTSFPPEIINLHWNRKPFVATKGISEAPKVFSEAPHLKNRDAILTAISKARSWVQEMVEGRPLIEIAQRERKGERQIRLLISLAFVPPKTVKALVDGAICAGTVTELAKKVALIWPSPAAGAN